MSTGVTDSDLRRALLLFSIGFALVLFDFYFLVTDFAVGLAAEGTTVDPEFTSNWITNGLLITSVSIMVLSQLWYLRTKHILNESGNYLSEGRYREFIRGMSLEVLILLIILMAPISFALSGVSPALAAPFIGVYYLLIISEVGSVLYFPMIMSWNFKHLIDRRYPELERYLRNSLSLLLGLISVVIFVLVLTLAVILILMILSAVERRLLFRSVVETIS